ncbi:MAG: glycosyltransferase [Anaerolinea sp.]|nr:glycosyltransferase [Anaerolinea sp.]
MNFLVFAPNPWHDLWRNRQQIFSRLAARHRVLYVEPARASLADWRRGRVDWAAVRRPAVAPEQPNLWLYRIPAMLPTRATGDLFDRASDRLLAVHLRRTLRKLSMVNGQRSMVNGQRSMVNGQRSMVNGQRSMVNGQRSMVNDGHAVGNRPLTIDHRPVLWLYRPTHWRWFAANFPHSLLVYHITDDYAAFGHLSDAQRGALLAEEQELLAAADLTIVTAPRLLELKAPHARRIELAPNGVDAQAFQHAAATAIPRGLAAPPRLGYSGHVSSRLDLALLIQLARARPDWQLAFAGSEWDAGCAAELRSLKALPNVQFLGLLPVEEVPAFIAGCDVCLIPYRVNDETRAISSLKLYEYLAAGRPVVSARVPAAEEHAAVVRLADATVASWMQQIEGALAEGDDATQAAARQAVAQANTWEQRVARIEALLADLLSDAG